MIYTLRFGDYEFPNQTFEIEGLPLENDVRDNPIPRMHGGVVLTPFLSSRRFRISGIIHNASAADSLTQLLAMQSALLAGEDKFKYSGDRYINCYVSTIDPQFEKGTDKAVINVDIDLLAQNPFLYSDGASYLDGFTMTGITESFSVASDGNAFSEPIIHFYASGGTISDGISLENTDTGASMRWRGIVPAGQTLSVDSDTLEVMLGSTDGISNFEGEFLTLVPPTSNFQFSGSACRIIVEHKYRWLS
jgi:hypothetical protein